MLVSCWIWEMMRVLFSLALVREEVEEEELEELEEPPKREVIVADSHCKKAGNGKWRGG